MKINGNPSEQATDMEKAVSLCYGRPEGDELPQVASVDDILVDIYCDALNMPHEYAAGRVHHQYGDDFGYFEEPTMIH